MANELLTPKQVARAIGVSESSLKRWCDRGVLPFVLTPGGHRRLPISGVFAFLRDTKQPLVHPEVLGLPSTTGQGQGVTRRVRAHLVNGLLSGDEEVCRKIFYDLHLAGRSVADIADRVVAEAFHEIGNRWACGEAAVYQERRACRITLMLMAELRSALPKPNAAAPVAIGGSASGDYYDIASVMAEAVCAQRGWNASTLGNNLPFATLRIAVQEIKPRLMWLSVSHTPDAEEFQHELADFQNAIPEETTLVVGGRGVTEEMRTRLDKATFCASMRQLESLLASERFIEPAIATADAPVIG